MAYSFDVGEEKNFFSFFFFLHEEATQFSANVVVVVVVQLFGGGAGVWVCSSVWLVKHSSYPNNKESRCRSCLSCVKPFGPFFSLNTACACCYIILIGERERESGGAAASERCLAVYSNWDQEREKKRFDISRFSFFFFFLFPSLIIIYKFRPDVVSSLLCRRRNPASLFRADWYACMRARAHRRRFIYCPSSPANSTTGHNALKRCQTRFPSRVNNGGMDGMTTTHKQIESDETCQPQPQSERERDR